MADQILRIQTNVHVAQNHGAQVNGRNFHEMQDPVRGRNGGKEDAKKFSESHGYGGNGSGLDDQKQRPAIEKSPQRARAPRANKHIVHRLAASWRRVRRSSEPR